MTATLKIKCLNKIKKRTLICFLLLFPIFEPQCISDHVFGNLDIIYRFIIFLGATYTGLDIFVKKKKIPLGICLFIFMEVWLLILTRYYSKGFNGYFWKAATIIYMLLIVTDFSQEWNSLTNALMLHAEICIYLNVLSLIIFPERMYGLQSAAYGYTYEWFLGADNQFIEWLFPGAVISRLYHHQNKSEHRSMFLTFAIFVNLFMQSSSTAIVGVFLFFLMTWFPIIKAVVTPFRAILATAFVFLNIVVFKNFTLVSGIVENVLHKDLTFTGRLSIWDGAVTQISERPLLGHGVYLDSQMVPLLGWLGATHCHDHYLQILFTGGAFVFAIFIGIQVLTLVGLRKKWDDSVARELAYALIAFDIICITEVLEYPLIYLIVALAACYGFSVVGKQR
jgi:O-antigen ligase